MSIRKYINAGIFLLLCGNSSLLHAQQYWTLQQCIDQALKNNLTVKQRELTLRSNKADHFQSRMNLLPSVNGQVTNNINTGFSINPVTNQTLSDATFRSNNFVLSASMTLFNGFQNTNNVRLQESNVRATEKDVVATKNNIALAVANAFMGVLLNDEIVKARQFQIESTKEQLARQQKLFELGSSNKVRVLQLKAQVANEELQLVTAQNQLQQSYLTLWQTLNINPDTSNKVLKPASVDLKTEDENMNADQIYATFKEKSPEISAAKQRLRSAQLSEYMAKGGRSPRLTASAGVNSFYTTQSLQPSGTPTIGSPTIIGVDNNGNFVYSIPIPRYTESEVVPFNTQFDRNLGKNIGLTLSLPIFNGWQVNNSIQKARINQEIASLNQQQTDLDVYKNVNQAYLDFKSAQKQYESSLLSYEANKEAFDLANSQLNLGAINTNDYITTRNQFLSAETTLLQAKYQLLFRRKVLDFYLGKPLY